MKQAFLDRYAGTGAYIALRYTRDAGTATYYFVDDILVETIPACPPVTFGNTPVGYIWDLLSDAFTKVSLQFTCEKVCHAFWVLPFSRSTPQSIAIPS